MYVDYLCAIGEFDEDPITYPKAGHSYMASDRAPGWIEIIIELNAEEVSRSEIRLELADDDSCSNRRPTIWKRILEDLRLEMLLSWKDTAE